MYRHDFKKGIINFSALFVLFLALLIPSLAGGFSRYIQGLIISVCINIILAASLNLTTGFLGQITLGHAGFMSVGAYSAGLVAKALPLPDGIRFLLCIIIGGITAAVFGVIIGIPAFRLKGDYLAILTLGFGEIIRTVIENLKFTGGAQGLRGIPRVATPLCLTIAFWSAVFCIGIMFCFVRSRHGLEISAIRDDDIASEACGIDNAKSKITVFAASAFFAGVAGGIYAQYLGIISASAFNYLKSIDIMAFVILGGMGSLTGSAVAAAALTLLPEVLRGFSEYRMIIYSVSLIVLMIFKPSGLFGRYEFSFVRLLEKLGLTRRRKNEYSGA